MSRKHLVFQTEALYQMGFATKLRPCCQTYLQKETAYRNIKFGLVIIDTQLTEDVVLVIWDLQVELIYAQCLIFSDRLTSNTSTPTPAESVRVKLWSYLL